MRKPKALAVCWVAVFVLVAAAMAEEFHIWKDERGVTHISQQPLSTGGKVAQEGRTVTLDPPEPVQAQAQQMPMPQTLPKYPPAPAKPTRTRDDFDLTGVEWRQSRGSYSGRRSEETTKKYGYRAGTYRLEYKYRGGRHFALWVQTRRGDRKLLINIVGSRSGTSSYTLPLDDEVWFEVYSNFGNWEFTFERVG